MTERTIRSVAKALAEKCYEMTRVVESMGPRAQWKRGERAFLDIDPLTFGKLFPTADDYISGRCHGRLGRTFAGQIYHIDNGTVSQVEPGWMHFVALAKEQLAARLSDPNTPDHRKEQIFDALLEEHENGQRADPRRIRHITQRKSLMQ